MPLHDIAILTSIHFIVMLIGYIIERATRRKG